MTKDTPRYQGQTPHDPPFDDSLPCPACPMAVRDLYATVHNYVGAVQHADDLERQARKFQEMVDSLHRIEALVNAHFADQRHAQGRL